MKKLMFVLAAAFILMTNMASAQKFAYVNSQYILDNMPEYKAAQVQLDQLSVQWQKEIEAKYAEIDKLYKAFQAEKIFLTDEMQRKREEEIMNKEREVKEYQKQRFGYEGDLYKKRQELVKPIQDKVYNAIKKMAEEGGYAFIFDKSSDLIMLYSSAKYDKSDDVLASLGIKPGGEQPKK